MKGWLDAPVSNRYSTVSVGGHTEEHDSAHVHALLLFIDVLPVTDLDTKNQ
jgi:hypothetical protein